MIDINTVLDLVKLKFYNEWIYTQVYDEGESPLFHKTVTEAVVKKYIDPLELDKGSLILDMGCGPGYFIDEMKARGYTDVLGITLSDGDIKVCNEKGHVIKKYDMSFIPQKDGFHDESVDFIFCRQSLEHSPYPIFTLIEFNRLLKLGSYIYIEVPTPDNERKHEFNANHYSVLGSNQLHALLVRTGFKIEQFEQIDFGCEITLNPNDPNSEKQPLTERFYCIVAKKQQTLDIK